MKRLSIVLLAFAVVAFATLAWLASEDRRPAGGAAPRPSSRVSDPPAANPGSAAPTSRQSLAAEATEPTDSPASETAQTPEKAGPLAFGGRVVDSTGQPVADAEVVVSPPGGGEPMTAVAHSDRWGRFSFELEGNNRWVAARVSGSEVSETQLLNERNLDPEALVLVLAQPVGTVTGSVVDAFGAPVADARVALGPHPKHRPEVVATPYPPGVRGKLAPEVRSGSDGSFRCPTVPTGPEVPIWVRADGHAPWYGTLEVLPGQESFLSIQFGRSVRLSGVVRDSDGRALAGVDIDSFARLKDPMWMGSSTTSSSDGAYAIESLSSGPLVVAINDAFHGDARLELEAEEGAELFWDPVLDPGLRIFGYLRDERGEALEGWMVEMHGPKHRRMLYQTDAEGRFAALHCDPDEYRVSVLQRDAWMPTRVALASGVRPDHGPLNIEVASDSLASAYITGEVRDARDQPRVSMVTLRVERGASSQSMSQHLPAGPFSLGPLPAGSYGVDLYLAGHAPTRLKLELQRTETRNLGVLRPSKQP